jgi:1,2-diacylglycerol 3-alpha-glucosyltransferase
MRILFVTNNYTPYSGGLVSSITATVKALREQGHEVIVAAPDFLGTNHDDPEWVRRVPSLIRFRYKKKHIAFPWGAKRYLNDLIKEFDPDVIHIHHPFLLGTTALELAKEKGIKTVFTYHTMYEAYAHYLPLPQFITKPYITNKVVRFCRKVDHIVAPSSTIQKHLQAHDLLQSTIIPSGLKEQFVGVPFMPRSLKKPFQLLYVGRFVKEKNITALFEVMELLPDEYELTLVGYGQYLDVLQEYAYDGLKLSRERVRFIIKPEQETLLDLYCSSDLFLFPSHTDTQGLVIAEALAFSLPVIAFDGPGQRDSIADGENGFVVAGCEQMAEKIQQILGDTELYKQLRKNAWESAGRFNPHFTCTQLISLYQQ